MSSGKTPKLCNRESDACTWCGVFLVGALGADLLHFLEHLLGVFLGELQIES